MAEVSAVRLHADRLSDESDQWTVQVSYRVALEPWETSTWFRELVEIVGLVHGREKPIVTFTGKPLAYAVASVERLTPAVALSAASLDVNPDLVADVGRYEFALRFRDDIQARVTLQPLIAHGASATSPVVSGQFGCDVPVRT